MINWSLFQKLILLPMYIESRVTQGECVFVSRDKYERGVIYVASEWMMIGG